MKKAQGCKFCEHKTPSTSNFSSNRNTMACDSGRDASCSTKLFPVNLSWHHLPVLHDNWSSIRSLRDAQGTAMLIANHTKQKGRHDPCDCFQRCREIKGIDLFGRMQVRANPVPLAAQNEPKITGMRSRGVILLVHDESSRCKFCNANSNNFTLSIKQEHGVACESEPSAEVCSRSGHVHLEISL